MREEYQAVYVQSATARKNKSLAPLFSAKAIIRSLPWPNIQKHATAKSKKRIEGKNIQMHLNKWEKKFSNRRRKRFMGDRVGLIFHRFDENPGKIIFSFFKCNTIPGGV